LAESQIHWADNRVLNVEKSSAVTSYRIVEQVKRLLCVAKAGHAGSLDPFATGVLLVCTGRATKITRFLMELEKEYLGTVRLGIETDTDDLSGEVLSSRKDFYVSEEDVERAVRSFIGRTSQHPPRVSALKQKGKRLYDMVRRGQHFETEAREVTIHDFQLRAFRFPELDFFVRCSRGTYVRALARDLGKKLGCGAHLSALRRTRVGPFDADGSLTLDRLREMNLSPGNQRDSQSVVPMEQALGFLPSFRLRAGEEQGVLWGRSPDLSRFESVDTEAGPNQNVRILSPQGELLAVGKTPSPEAEPVVRLERVLAVADG
jgi:tRNA pseudouridine55 synthase